VKSLRSPEHDFLIDLLVSARKNSGLTQQALAERLGRPQSFVAKVEGGERRLDVIEMIAIARALGADPAAWIRELGRRARQSTPRRKK
jgi:transcriptional regulator with XRE-family HTH domain